MIWDKSGTKGYFGVFRKHFKLLIRMVIAARLERATYCLEGLSHSYLVLSVNHYFHLRKCIKLALNKVNTNLILSSEVLIKSKVSGTNLGQIKKLRFGIKPIALINYSTIPLFFKNVSGVICG